MAHSDVQVGEALIALATNKYDFEKTAEQTGVSVSSLKRWAKTEPKKGVFELLERALERCLMRVDEVPAGDLPIFIGILMDKWLLAQGEPTARTEGIFRGLEGLTDDERKSIVVEAERILARATSSRAGVGDSQP